MSLDEVMKGLRAAEEDGWIAMHLEDDREIEVFRFLPRGFQLPVHTAVESIWDSDEICGNEL